MSEGEEMKPQEVKALFEAANDRMQAAINEFPWEDPEAYVSWLAQTLEYVKYTTRILALTGSSFPLEQTALASRFIQHATEERGHDKMLYNDAKALGFDLAKMPTTPEAEAFHKSIYFWIYQSRPAVVMGWVILLEGFAVRNGERVHARVEKAHGKKASTFLKVHTAEDPGHLDAAFAALAVFSEKELEDVAHGIELYAKLYGNIFDGVRDALAARPARKQAA